GGIKPSQLDLRSHDVLRGGLLEPFHRLREVTVTNSRIGIVDRNVMCRSGMALARRAQKPARRFSQIERNAGPGRIKGADDILRLSVAEFGGACVPVRSLPQVRRDATATGVKLSKPDDCRQVILLCSPSQVALRPVHISRQAVAIK